MALNKIGVIRGITDAAFKPIGGTQVDVKGIAALKWNPDVVTAETYGDDSVISLSSKMRKIKFSFEHAVVDLDTLSAITGYTLSAGGSGSAETYTLDLDTDLFPYFSFECRSINIVDNLGSTGDNIADVHFKIYKAKITKIDFETGDDKHWQISFEAEAIPDPTTNKIASIIFYETATSISL